MLVANSGLGWLCLKFFFLVISLFHIRFKKEPYIDVEEIEIFDQDLDFVWENAKQYNSFIAVRNYNYLKTLYSDKESMKKREAELARIRAEQNRATTGNFAKMKGRLPWPVQGEIIGKFGTIRNPDTGVVIENVGIDIQAKSGTPVMSVLDGVVSTITYIRGHGNIIIIDHGGGFSTVYAQVDNITVHENEYVQKGGTIATVVKAVNNTPEKLHFEVWGNQQKLNPQIWLTH